MNTAAAKHLRSRATHYTATRQAWRHSKAYFELSDQTISVENVPNPYPPSEKINTGGTVERRGVVIAVPSPWVSKGTNKRAAQFWRSKGFELREAHNSPHFVEGYVKEWVRFCSEPLNGQVFSAKAWLEAVTRKHEEFYL